MTDVIKRLVRAHSGTSVRMDGNHLVIAREPGRPNRPEAKHPDVKALADAVSNKDWDAARASLKKLTDALADEQTPLSDDALFELHGALKETVAAAERADSRSVVGTIFLLGIPALIDATSTSEPERVRDAAKGLRSKLDALERFDPTVDRADGVMATDEDGDISDNMNLYVGNGLLDTTSKLAAAFGGDYVAMSDAVASLHYSESYEVKPADFERSAGVLLIDKKSRQLVSRDSSGYFRMELDGKAVFKAADGKNYFAPTGEAEATPVPEDAQPKVIRLRDSDVGARARLPNDPDARPNMKFRWHGYSSGELDIGWWGQCESSGMLGSMGLMPAKEDVTLFDEKTGGEVKMSADDVTDMMVFMGRNNYFSTSPAERAGNINRNKEEVDSDKAIDFHNFVMKQIENGLPFNLEAHSYEQIWNYPVHRAAIRPNGAKTRVGGGGYSQAYEMTVWKSNGSSATYHYSITHDARGQATDSAWDMAKSESENGKTHAIPDKMKSYFSERRTEIRFGASGRSYYEDNKWTDDAIKMVADLYFASHAEPTDVGEDVFAVRTSDGRLLQLSAAEYELYRQEHAAPIAA